MACKRLCLRRISHLQPMRYRLISESALLALVLIPPLVAQQAVTTQQRAMTLKDVMQFRYLQSQVISASGHAVAYEARPDRGDGEAVVHMLETGEVWRVPRGTKPVIAKGDRWMRATVAVPFVAEALRKKKGKAKVRPALALVNLATGALESIEGGQSAAFSENGHYVAWLLDPAEKKNKKAEGPKSKRTQGKRLVLRRLLEKGDAVADVTIENVTRFVFAPDAKRLSYVVCTADGESNGLFHRDLDSGRVQGELFARSVVTAITWNEASTQFACTVAPQADDGEKQAATVWVADQGAQRGAYPAITSASFGPDWVLHADTSLRWSKDGKRLHFGVRSKAMEDTLRSLKPEKKGATNDETSAKAVASADIYDFDALLKEREVDVWHYRDALISPNQKIAWSRESKRVFACVFDLAAKAPLRLADPAMPSIAIPEGSDVGLGRSNVPYAREMTWDGRYSDIYTVDVKTGKRQKVLERHAGSVSLSPRGRFLVWYDDGKWFSRDNSTAAVRELTAGIEVPFADEDHDYPRATPSYGVAGWYADESALLIYDKFDIWRFEPGTGARRCLTAGQGRKAKQQLRIVDLDPELAAVDAVPGPLVLTCFDTGSKEWRLGILGDQGLGDQRPDWLLAKKGPDWRLAKKGRYRVLAKAEDAARLLFSYEDYDCFPDLSVSGLDLSDAKQVSHLDAQRAPFLWGTSELVSWQNEDGKTLQGAVIKPGNYDPKRRYPVLVYYYRFFSQRVHEWDPVLVNHRPCFPYWASNGYIVFLPDIRFDIGYPGHSATKCLVPGIEKLVDLGIADPKAIALHGHSWSGYQSAHVITETNIFACAIAGAPVSNMTSAYGGVRWGSGMSRQFQYEKTQSRIGGTLWDARDKYIENSPVFFADKIQTPLLIQFGDEDGAVPWYQGIELYMAMRRLDKPCVFLQYRGEPHHLKKYANKLDYTIRFKQYVDHYCKGTPAPVWIKSGEPYAGK